MPSQHRASWSSPPIVLAGFAVLVYVGVWVGFRLHWAWLDSLDSRALEPLHNYGVRHPGWVRFWDIFCAVLGPNFFRALGAVAIVVAALQRSLRVVFFVLASIGLSGVVATSAKALAQRPRPAGALANAAASSFPSGHAVGVMVGVLALFTITSCLLRPPWRAVAIATGTVVVLGIGFGRVALNVHYPSDVLAGWSLGYLWFLACLLTIRPVPLGVSAVPDRSITDAATAETPEAPGSGR
jgi:membrane-associated phospholipid phosphatase